MADQIVDVPCPLCRNKTHRYLLTVEIASISIGRNKAIATTIRKIKRLFLCPEKNELFEAIIELQESSDGEIKDTAVKGIVEEE